VNICSIFLKFSSKFVEGCSKVVEEVLKVVHSSLKGEKKEKVFLSTLGENLKERLYG